MRKAIYLVSVMLFLVLPSIFAADEQVTSDYFKDKDFLDQSTMEKGDEFFSSVQNINGNPGLFSDYLSKKYGLSVTFDKAAQMSEFNMNTGHFVTSGERSTSIEDISTLKNKQIKIETDGSITIDGTKYEGKDWSYDPNKGFSNSGEAKINGYEFKNGKDIVVKNGIISGKFDSFEKVEFKTAVDLDYDSSANVLKIKESGAEIEKIGDNKVSLAGTDISLPNGNKLIKGKISYEKGIPVKLYSSSEAILDNKIKAKVKTKDVDIELRALESHGLKKLREKEDKEKAPLRLSIDLLEKSIDAIAQDKTEEAEKLQEGLESQLADLRKKMVNIDLRYTLKRQELEKKLIPETTKNLGNDYLVFTDSGLVMSSKGKQGFTVSVEDGKKVFYGTETALGKKSLEFTVKVAQIKWRGKLWPKGAGKLNIARNSPEVLPLKLDVEAEGGFEIKNGNTKLRSKNGDSLRYANLKKVPARAGVIAQGDITPMNLKFKRAKGKTYTYQVKNPSLNEVKVTRRGSRWEVDDNLFLQSGFEAAIKNANAPEKKGKIYIAHVPSISEIHFSRGGYMSKEAVKGLVKTCINGGVDPYFCVGWSMTEYKPVKPCSKMSYCVAYGRLPLDVSQTSGPYFPKIFSSDPKINYIGKEGYFQRVMAAPSPKIKEKLKAAGIQEDIYLDYEMDSKSKKPVSPQSGSTLVDEYVKPLTDKKAIAVLDVLGVDYLQRIFYSGRKGSYYKRVGIKTLENEGSQTYKTAINYFQPMNGFGKRFDKPYPPIKSNKAPIYGYQQIDLMNQLRNNPQLASMIKSVEKETSKKANLHVSNQVLDALEQKDNPIQPKPTMVASK